MAEQQAGRTNDNRWTRMAAPKPDCWVETSVRCKGGRAMSGFYILGHYPTVAEGRRAIAAHVAAYPKACAFLTVQPGCPLS